MATQLGPANVDILRRTCKADFLARLEAAGNGSIFKTIAMREESDSDQETYAFFGNIPKPVRTDRKGGKIQEFRPLNDFSIAIENATWKMVVPFHREILEDAKLNQIKSRSEQQADSAAMWMDEQLTLAIEANGNSYDNTAFFGSTHDLGSGNGHANDITVDITTPAAPTIAEMETGIGAGLTRMRILLDDQNRIANPGDLKLYAMVSPNHEFAAKSILSIGPVAGQTGNAGVYHNIGTPIVNPFMTTTDRFYLFATYSSIKPIVFQERRSWEFKLKTDGDDWDLDDTGYMISESRWNFGYGDHKKAVRVVFT